MAVVKTSFLKPYPLISCPTLLLTVPLNRTHLSPNLSAFYFPVKVKVSVKLSLSLSPLLPLTHNVDFLNNHHESPQH